MAIDQQLLKRGQGGASLFDQAIPGLFAQQQQALERSQDPRSNLLKKIFPGLFKPSKKEQAALDKAQAGETAALESSAKAIAGQLNLAGIGDAAALPAVRDTIQAAATGDAGAVAGINALLFEAPAAKAARAATAQQAQDANDRANIQLTNELQQQEKYGGMSVELHTTRSDRFGKLQQGRQNIEDLLTLNAELGRETLPGEARGAYEALRGQAINSLRIQFEAGALQEAEIEFFNTFIPEFGVWNSLTAGERRQKLKELQRQTGIEQQGIALTTKGLEYDPNVQGRTIDEIFFRATEEGFTSGLPQTPSGIPLAPGQEGAPKSFGEATARPGTGPQAIADFSRGLFAQ